MGFVITDLSHQRTHTLPLYLLGVIVKRSEGEDKVENDTKQKKKKKKRLKQKMSTRFK